MDEKKRKYKHYPESMKLEAIRLHTEEQWSYRQITEHFGIQDKDRVKKWMRKHRENGADGLVDRRGDPFRIETEEARRVRRLEMEVEILKKWLQILNREVRGRNTSL
jgi:transposase-like protein